MKIKNTLKRRYTVSNLNHKEFCLIQDAITSYRAGVYCEDDGPRQLRATKILDRINKVLNASEKPND